MINYLKCRSTTMFLVTFSSLLTHKNNSAGAVTFYCVCCIILCAQVLPCSNNLSAPGEPRGLLLKSDPRTVFPSSPPSSSSLPPFKQPGFHVPGLLAYLTAISTPATEALQIYSHVLNPDMSIISSPLFSHGRPHIIYLIPAVVSHPCVLEYFICYII